MKPARILLILAVIALVVVTLVNKCGGDQPQAAGPGAGAAAGPLAVSAVVVRPQRMADDLMATGALLANNSVELRNEVPGRLVTILFEEGRPVEKGALLVKIYDTDLQAQLRKLQLDEETAARNEQRQKDLLSINGISQQEYDIALNKLSGLRADIDVLKAQIGKTEIRAPFAGVVGLRAVSEGAYLAANTLIATLQQLDPIKLDFTVPERYRDRLKVNDTISFEAGSGTGLHYGRIYAFEPMVDPGTRALKIRALCANHRNDLLPGSFVKVRVALKEINDALMIPSQAVIPELRGQKVMVSRNGKAASTKVEVGLRTDSLVQVLSGIDVGDTVLITGIMQARPDVPLRVTVVNAGSR